MKYEVIEHDCYELLRKGVVEQTGDPEASLNLAYIFTKSGQGYMDPNVTGTYRKKDRHGVFQKKEHTINFYSKFCPFCGKPFLTEIPEPSDTPNPTEA